MNISKVHGLICAPQFVYLAGPILGCTALEATDWRAAISEKLLPHNIIGVSPLRCEPLIGERYSTEYPDPCFGTPRAIAAKNMYDVDSCNMTLAFLPKPTETLRIVDCGIQVEDGKDVRVREIHHEKRIQSYGTIIELGWSSKANKRVILVTDDPFVAVHPVVDASASWKFVCSEGPLKGDPRTIVLPDLKACFDAAIRTIVGVLGGYTGGKNV